MTKIKGITVKLYEKTKVGTDAFGTAVYEEVPVEIKNVLVAPVSSSSLADAIHPDGKIAVYTLAIPKGDTHQWENKKVEFFGRVWRTVGFAYEGIESMIPLDWNRKVQVEAYD